MGALVQVVQDFFKSQEWPIVDVEGTNIFQTSFSSDKATWGCVIQVIEEINPRFLFFSVCPLKAQGNLTLTAEFVTRANYGLPIGSFEMDFEDGEIRFRTGIDVVDDSLSPEAVERLVYTNVLVMDQYLPGLVSVLSGSQSPLDAIRAVESVEAPTDSEENSEESGVEKN